tara:strand:+ start:2023 stop:2769 length:747 start_codon:yes stop_codon:yes gene_type:complete
MKISIITLAKNCDQKLLKTIKSVNRQKNVNIEHLIIYKNLNKDFDLKKINTKKIKFINNKKSGIYPSLNFGIKKSSGKIIGMLHSDDIFNSDHILSKIQKDFIIKKWDLLYGNIQYINKNNRIIRDWISSNYYNFSQIKNGWMPPHTSMFVQKKIFNNVKYYNENYRIASDYDFIIRSFKNEKIKKRFFNHYITKMIIGGESNKNLFNIYKKMKEDFQILKKNKISNPIITLIKKNLRKISQFLNFRK